MKRTTVFLDEALERDLQAIARQGNRPMASVVREALAAYVAGREPDAGSTPSFVAAGASGRRDIADRHEALLWRNPHPRGAGGPGRRRPAARKRR